MSLRVINSLEGSSAGIPVVLGVGQNLLVTQNGVISYEGPAFLEAVNSTFSATQVRVAGTVSGVLGIKLDGLSSGVAVTASGAVFGDTTGVALTASGATVSNAGLIQGGAFGVVFSAGNSILTNSGDILGGTTGFGVRLGGGATVTNEGLISGATGLLTSTGVTATIRVTNGGTIEGTGAAGTAAVLLGNGNDLFINGGLVLGAVQTGLGNDVYDGDGGRVRGAIDLGSGSDTGDGGDRADVFVALADDGNDVFNGGGGGFDTYDASGETLRGLTLDLAKGVARFEATGAIDIIDGFERVTGGGGADAITGTDRAETLTGNGGADRLTGRGGRDYLFGGTGDDRLDGGDGSDVLVGQGGNDVVLGGTGDDIIIAEGGRDTMTGGAGADDFIFTNLERDSSQRYIPDRITDFQVGIDTIDLSAFDASSQVAGNQTFTFVGTGAAMLGACGYTVQGGVTRVWIYAEAGTTPVKEVIIELTGTLVLTAGDFVL